MSVPVVNLPTLSARITMECVMNFIPIIHNTHQPNVNARRVSLLDNLRLMFRWRTTVILLMLVCVPFSLAQPHLNANRTSCTEEDFVCRADARACVPRVQWQDGVDDCADGSDERELYGVVCVRAHSPSNSKQ